MARRDRIDGLISIIMLFEFSACVLLMLRQKPADLVAAGLAFGLPALTWLSSRLLPRRVVGDPLLVALMNFLCGLGVIILYSMVPERALKQALLYALGMVVVLIAAFFVRTIRAWRYWCYLMIPAGLGLLLLPVLIGQETNGAKNWIEVTFIGSFQPSELVKLMLVLLLSYFFSQRRGLPGQAPGLVFTMACLGLLMLQKDLGTALMYYLLTLVLFYVASSNLPLTLAGVGGGAAAAVVGYQMFSHVRVRVAVWKNPWADILGNGYQIVQALMAIASGGVFGLGLGLGHPRAIPAYYTDFIFAVICEQFGILFGLLVLLVYVLIILRGVHIALCARRHFLSLVAMGCTLLLGLQTFVILGGVIKLIPLTGITLTFVSYGGTSLLSCMALIGMLCGVAARNEQDLRDDAAMTAPEEDA